MKLKGVPKEVVRLSYVARSSAGLGHYRSSSMTVTNRNVVLDLGDVAEGVWRIELTGRDGDGRAVYEEYRSATVRRYERTIVRIGDPPPKR